MTLDVTNDLRDVKIMPFQENSMLLNPQTLLQYNTSLERDANNYYFNYTRRLYESL